MAKKNCCTVTVLIWSFLVFYGFWGAIIYGYSYYAWGNGAESKDNYQCYASNKEKDVYTAYDASASGLHNVSQNFHMVCNWGAITYMLILVLFTMMLCLGERALDDCEGCVAFLVGGAFVNWLAHFLTLMIMRWRHAGKVCSGDYLDMAETGFSRYALTGVDPPYIHETGSFLWYAIQS